MTQPSQHADVVIIGQGGIVGASVAHHLIEQGWRNIVGLDKAGIPTDIGSTAHASDFCYMTAHDHMACYTTVYSRIFYQSMGHYLRMGGLEVARADDDAQMAELKRKVGSGRAFGTNVELIGADRAASLHPLVDENAIQGAMWDPDAGLVVPRSQRVAGALIQQAIDSGALETHADTPVLSIDTHAGRVHGVYTRKGYIKTEHIVQCTGIWGPLLAGDAGETLPLMPFEHPLMFLGPYEAFADTGKELGYPLLRDQGNSSYMRDTGDPTTAEGGYIEWGYYEHTDPRLVPAAAIAEPEEAGLSPSMRELFTEQVLSRYERVAETMPILGELGWDEHKSFNGLLSVTVDGSSLVGEAPDTRGLWFCEAVWVKDGPGMGKVLADWMTTGQPEVDPHGIDIARFYPIQKSRAYIQARCGESARKIYTPPVHPREPYAGGRDLRHSAFYPREVELGAYFLEAAGWERAHGYAANETRLADYMAQVPQRANEWDGRHFWRVSNAEHLAISDGVGMIDLSHFAIFDVAGPDAEAFMDYLSVAKVGGSTPVGKGVYTHFLTQHGGIHSDLTVIRLGESAWRVICGGDTGHRDWLWMRRMHEDRGFDVRFEDRTDALATLGLWGPQARATLQQLADDPDGLSRENFGFATAREIRIQGMPVWAFRISYVGEQGWELYVPFSYGLRLWDLLFDQGVVPVGVETYANSRRLENSLRLQNVDLLTEYNLYEAGLARAKVKDADFHGKAAYLAQRERTQQPACLCTLSMLDNVDANGVARYPVGQWPIIDPATGDVPVDELGRRSYATSVVYGPSVGRNLALAYLPPALAQTGGELQMEYFAERYPMRIETAGARGVYDPDNERQKS